MRIGFIGNTQQSHCSEVHLGESLQALGHQVEHWQENQLRQGSETRRALVSRLPAYDLVCYMRTWGFPGATGLWRRCSTLGIPTVTISLDVYWGVHRESMLARDAMFRTDFVFTADGNPHDWKRHNINHHWLRAGVLRSECADVMPGRVDHERYPWSVVFVGSTVQYHGEWPFRFELVRALRARYGDRFAAIPQDVGGKAVRGQALNDLYASVPVVVGDSLGASHGTRYWSDRFYETWGRGGFLVHPHIDALHNEVGMFPSYEPGDVDSALDAVDTWLCCDEPHPSLLGIGKRVAYRCTYTDRMVEMLRVVQR